MPPTKSTNPSSDRRPGGHGRRTGELKNATTLNATSGREAQRIKVLRDPLWEIQPAETQRAYERFRYYRDLGERRTQVLVAQEFGIVRESVDDLSSKYRWVERVRAFDAYYDTMYLAAAEQALRGAAQQWVARQSAIRETEYEIAMGLADKVREMLRYPVSRIRRERLLKDGKTYIIQITEPAKWDWKSAADILNKLAFSARLGADMVTDGARAPTPDMTDRGVADIDAWLKEIGVEAGTENDVPTKG